MTDILKYAGIPNDKTPSYSFSVAKMFADKTFTTLYDCIEDIREAYIIAQYEMSRKNNHELIFIFPGFNNATIKDMSNFEDYAISLIEKYTDKED